MPQWTKSQLDAIKARRGTILVSAAAGSGKTAVLVERAIERLTAEANPTPADKLLIVTFTRAAASEMRARIERRLGEMLRDDSSNEWLRKQIVLLGQASIGTIDSFCADLVRENFQAADIPADFKVMEQNHALEMQDNVISDVLDVAFESGDYDDLADAFTDERNDYALAAIIKKLHSFMQQNPSPEGWLRAKTDMLDANGKIASSPWGAVILSHICEALEYAGGLLESAHIAASQEESIFSAFAGSLEDAMEQLDELRNLTKYGTWDDISAALRGFKVKSLGKLKKEEKSSQTFIRTNILKEEVKSLVKTLGKLITSSESECIGEFTEIRRILAKLSELALSFTAEYKARKLEKGFLDFNDLEHCALKLLCDENGIATPLAREISERFDEVMIDEFQDVNEVQDLIFRSVSKRESNLFMVGDVKQSIYGFRSAEPRIFIRKHESYNKYDSLLDNYPAYIILDRNFRSRKSVTESVNFVFSQLMSKAAGEIEYNEEEKLVCGADFNAKAGCETELIILRKQERIEAQVTEANFISEKIKTMISSGFTVKDKESGVERPAVFSDFAVLLRSANSYAHDYAEILANNEIPARADISGGFFDAQEIRLMLALLRIIDNPNQDIALLAVLLSPIYGFTPDDLAALRMNNRHEPLYISVLRKADEDARYKKILSDLEEYRNFAATMPSDAFISMLYTRTGYADIVLAMEEGDNRLTNLRVLQRFAKDYESSGYNGISGFVRYIEKMKQNSPNMDISTDRAEKNCVRVMSAHKSKGLEFPVCIIAGCGRKAANNTDSVLLNQDLGMGIRIRDNRLGARFTTMPREAIKLANDEKEAAEELRVLYVAMTRAREKLIMLGTAANPESEIMNASADASANASIAPYAVKKAKSFLQLLLLSALRHPSGETLREIAGNPDGVVYEEHFTPWKIEIVDQEAVQAEAKREYMTEIKPDYNLIAEIKKRADFIYPFENLTLIPSKVTASGIVSKERGAASEILLKRPSWLGVKGFSPAERGTALHEFMQYADFKKAAANPAAELERLLSAGFITEEQGEIIDLDKVKRFFSSELGSRVLSSPDVQKERRFTVEVSARDVIEEADSEEKIILQGAADCTFVENGKINIIDFKTDNVSSAEELLPIYKTQLALYAMAMEKTSGYEVGDCFIYSIRAGDYIKIP